MFATGEALPYEPPLNPELVIATAECTPEEAAGQIIDYLERTGKLASAVG